MHIQQGNPSARGGFVCESPSPRASLQLDPMLDFEFENPRIYEPIYRNDVEELELYTYGGYYPVHLHDVLMDRYKIRAKLGFGNYYTLWLAEDLEIQDRPVAIKIFTANFTADTTRHQPYLLRCAVQSENSFGGREYIAQIEDMFTVEGPNGEHLCIVMDMYGASLAQYQAGYVNGRMSMKGFLPLEMVKRIACQVAKGLAYLHSIGIVHGGGSAFNGTILKKVALTSLTRRLPGKHSSHAGAESHNKGFARLFRASGTDSRPAHRWHASGTASATICRANVH